MTGIAEDATHSHIIRFNDGKAAVWVGAIDDVWQLGKPRGIGGPWKDTRVEANAPSDPYLMTGFDAKTLSLSHRSKQTVTIRLELDITGDGLWRNYKSFAVLPVKRLSLHFRRTSPPIGCASLRTIACEGNGAANLPLSIACGFEPIRCAIGSDPSIIFRGKRESIGTDHISSK